jgi:nitrogen fixation protein NifT
LKLENGGVYYVDPMPRPERLPVSVAARRLVAAED